MERFKSSRFILPRRLSHGIDDKRSRYHHNAPDDQDGIPHGIATHGNLSGRDEAENESQQGTQEAHSGYQPHQTIAFTTDAERTFCLLHIVTQIDGCRKHQQVHDEVKQDGELRKDLIKALHRRHHHKQQAQQGHDTSLDKEDVLLHTDAISLLEERRQVTGTTNGKDTFRRTGYPCQHTGQDTESQGNGDNR